MQEELCVHVCVHVHTHVRAHTDAHTHTHFGTAEEEASLPGSVGLVPRDRCQRHELRATRSSPSFSGAPDGPFLWTSSSPRPLPPRPQPTTQAPSGQLLCTGSNLPTPSSTVSAAQEAAPTEHPMPSPWRERVAPGGCRCPLQPRALQQGLRPRRGELG